MKLPLNTICLLFFTLVTLQCFSQGKIEQSKKEIKKGADKPKDPGSQPAKSSKSDNDKTIGEIFFEGVGKVFLYITYYTTIGSYKTEQHLHSKVTKYPYYNNQSGNYENPDTASHSKNHFRFDADYQFLYSNKNLTGNHFKCNIRPFQYFYVQAQYHQLTEKVSNTQSNLSLFNFNLCYDRLRFEKFNLGWKAGMCYIADNVNMAGFSVGLDAEAFVVKPVSVYVSKQWGSIHRVAVNEFELGAKFHLKRLNIHAGYEHLKIGSPLYNYAFIGAGVRL
jgi:hypothetical protein